MSTIKFTKFVCIFLGISFYFNKTEDLTKEVV